MKLLSSVLNTLRSIYWVLLVSIIFLVSQIDVKAQDLDVPYVPTPENVVERMLDVTDVKSSDYVVDLGSGDGRIVIAAAKRGASGHGIDLDPKRIAEARENATDEEVDNRIMFMEEDIFDTDFSEASVITMYLLPSVNKKLRPKLLNDLQPGTQVVSHSFDMGSWKADEEIVVRNNGSSHDIYYWVIPSKVEGEWTWNQNDTEHTLSISQRFQEISAKITDGSDAHYDITQAELEGKRINIRAAKNGEQYIFSGRVENDTIYGMMQHHNNSDKNLSQWEATRK